MCINICIYTYILIYIYMYIYIYINTSACVYGVWASQDHFSCDCQVMLTSMFPKPPIIVQSTNSESTEYEKQENTYLVGLVTCLKALWHPQNKSRTQTEHHFCQIIAIFLMFKLPPEIKQTLHCFCAIRSCYLCFSEIVEWLTGQCSIRAIAQKTINQPNKPRIYKKSITKQ